MTKTLDRNINNSHSVIPGPVPLNSDVYFTVGDRSGAVFKVLYHKLEGRWFDPSWCHWNFSLT